MEAIFGWLILIYLVVFVWIIVRIAGAKFEDNCARIFWLLLVYLFPVGGILLWFIYSGRYIKKES
ncbi:hypothetical protein [Thermocrinis sp.]|uniref:hypothetical protein n=1 Tax=Thermocrinis sp. TaxID=2024383 RepID=UPI002FDE628C